MDSCQTCVIRNRAICSELEFSELEVLNAIGHRRQLVAGEQLIWEGEDAVLVANVIEGVLKLSNSMEDGREQIVGLVYPTDFIGRPFGATTPYGVEALTDARVCVFARRDFDSFARQHPRLEHKLLERTLAELDRTRAWMLLLGRKSAEERLATFLLEVSQRLEPETCSAPDNARQAAFELPFSRQQVGDVLGLTIETVSRQFTKLKRDGVIDLPSRRSVEIVDRRELEARAG
ncbi:cyclic nucleotide-binding domain-containing protein [Croceicoccus ponticola]|uniref:Cyclic nucleotide-binding domain-containing protein n=1 Tax=Croceicoccus ponticola TaxID=2217664 RepID=A0A437H168_9SPHN|nr:helix-turn-helix domain-containing protein [Croceicoccus ponticola]RVQ69397.1 cyclic nucleotide-binding domain-containing protein [Croceicoccus ponticola]